MTRLVKRIILKFIMLIKLFRIRLYVFTNDRENKYIPFYKKLVLNLKGFESDKWVLYNLSENNFNEYMSDYERWKSRYVNGNNNILLDDKIISNEIFGKYLNCPENIAYIENGIVRSFQNNKILDINDLISLVASKNKLVVKPINGASGKGVSFIYHDQTGLFFNDEKIATDKFHKYISTLDDFIITEFARQHEYADKLFSGTTNTIRILTMKDPTSGEFFIPVAIQRIGNNKSFPVDNWKAGAISAWIDVDTGILGRATHNSGLNEGKQFFERHPDTGAKITGVKIPNWEKTKEQLLKTASKMPQIPFVAWDVVITEESFSIIELNASTGVTIFQVHQPLLRNPKIKEFYEYHGVV